MVDLTLPGADAERRDVYVEVGWMRGEDPQSGVLQDVESVFDNALVINDQHRTGIGLHLPADEVVPHVAMPTPRVRRPPLSRSSAAVSRATLAGRRRGSGDTIGPSRSRSVLVAIAASAIHGSPTC